MAQIAMSNFLKVPATVQAQTNAADLIASETRADADWNCRERDSGAALD